MNDGKGGLARGADGDEGKESVRHVAQGFTSNRGSCILAAVRATHEEKEVEREREKGRGRPTSRPRVRL